MLYVSRDSQGNISELHPLPVGAAKEGLEADNPEVLQFIHERWRQNELTSLDRDFVRVIEDTLELLMAKDLILFTDLPAHGLGHELGALAQVEVDHVGGGRTRLQRQASNIAQALGQQVGVVMVIGEAFHQIQRQ